MWLKHDHYAELKMKTALFPDACCVADLFFFFNFICIALFFIFVFSALNEESKTFKPIARLDPGYNLCENKEQLHRVIRKTSFTDELLPSRCTSQSWGLFGPGLLSYKLHFD